MLARIRSHRKVHWTKLQFSNCYNIGFSPASLIVIREFGTRKISWQIFLRFSLTLHYCQGS
jgi:hypothetical protein